MEILRDISSVFLGKEKLGHQLSINIVEEELWL